MKPARQTRHRAETSPGWPPPRPPQSSAAGWTTVLACGALLLAIVAAPWPYGAVQPSVQVWLILALPLAGLCWLIGLRREPPSMTTMPWGVLVLVLAVIMALGQLALLPAPVLERLSPTSAQLRREMLAPLQDEAEPLLSGQTRAPLSLYPAGTRRQTALLVWGGVLFALGSRWFRSSRTVPWLLAALALNGAALAFFGIVQQLTWNGRLFWTVPLRHGGQPFASFVNRNHAAALLEICLAACVGLLVWLVARQHDVEPDDTYLPGLDDPRTRPRWWRSLARDMLDLVGTLDTPKLAAMTAGVLIGAAILASLSRGAVLATAAALTVTLLALSLSSGRRPRMILVLLAVVCAAALVGWVGLGETVIDRLATVLDEQVMRGEIRLAHWRVGLHAARDFPILGSGLGTYRYVYRLYEQEASRYRFLHAENQYLETWVQAGVVGLALLALMILVVAIAAVGLLRRRYDPASAGLAAATTMALAAQAVHAFFDFALYTPAVMMPLAVLCGACCGRAAMLPTIGDRQDSESPPKRSAALLSPLLIAALLAGGLWVWQQLRSAAVVEAGLEAASLPERFDQLSAADVNRQLAQLGEVSTTAPDDVDVRLRFAQLWTVRYRLAALDALQQRLGAEADPPRLWSLTAPNVLHAHAWRLEHAGDVVGLEQLRAEPAVFRNLLPAWQHLLSARQACPLNAEVHLRLAELSFLNAPPLTDVRHLQRAERLTPGQPARLYEIGALHYNAARFDEAFAAWHRTWLLAPQYQPRILPLVLAKADIMTVLDRVVPAQPEVLLELAVRQFADESLRSQREAVLNRAAMLLDRQRREDGSWYHLRGEVERMLGRLTEAAANFQQAVELQPGNVAWRYELALLLVELGRVEEAHEQARWCIRHDPQRTEYRQLLQTIYRLKP